MPSHTHKSRSHKHKYVVEDVLEVEDLSVEDLSDDVDECCDHRPHSAYYYAEKAKKGCLARKRERAHYDDNMRRRHKQIGRLRTEVNQAQDLVKEYSSLTEQLSHELQGVKDEARRKLKCGGKKYEKMQTKCSELLAQLKRSEDTLRTTKQQQQEGNALFETEVHSLRKELCRTEKGLDKTRHLAMAREAELGKREVEGTAMQERTTHLMEHLKESKKNHRHCQITKKIVEDELASLTVEYEHTKTLSEKLQTKVYHLKQELKADKELRMRQGIVALANDHYRNMKPYLGIVFVTEPWPVSSTHGTGTLLQQVKKGGAGHDSGLRKGDIVTEVNGKPTRNKTEFYASLYGVKPGDTMHLHIIRPSQGPGIVRAIDITAGASGYSLKQVLAVRRLAERDPRVYDVDFDVDLTLAQLKPMECADEE